MFNMINIVMCHVSCVKQVKSVAMPFVWGPVRKSHLKTKDDFCYNLLLRTGGQDFTWLGSMGNNKTSTSNMLFSNSRPTSFFLTLLICVTEMRHETCLDSRHLISQTFAIKYSGRLHTRLAWLSYRCYCLQCITLSCLQLFFGCIAFFQKYNIGKQVKGSKWFKYMYVYMAVLYTHIHSRKYLQENKTTKRQKLNQIKLIGQFVYNCLAAW